MEYIGFWVTRNRIRPINKKVEVTVNMTPPKKRCQVSALIGLVKYYMDMWDIQSRLLKSLTTLTSEKLAFRWTDVEQNSFDDIKCIMSCDTLLA